MRPAVIVAYRCWTICSFSSFEKCSDVLSFPPFRQGALKQGWIACTVLRTTKLDDRILSVALKSVSFFVYFYLFFIFFIFVFFGSGITTCFQAVGKYI
ncbi:hypothetical protein BDV28DRAFT_69082 [Aspergillus coremiiformis]|uniref:Uncharacterized protein n=1 Tax=Aspergillus coremiiformis TaxID=138285 RepID=A0A5N6YW06_9EURO|nr:hypothetical protein BDV28DRAFT_69082 [Aspergillus coremiiformis]